MSFKEMIKNKKITQKELADKIGVTQSAISHWCRRSTTPRICTMYKLADALDINISKIMECFKEKYK